MTIKTKEYRILSHTEPILITDLWHNVGSPVEFPLLHCLPEVTYAYLVSDNDIIIKLMTDCNLRQRDYKHIIFLRKVN